MSKTGLYVHIPFCVSKCVYCNFCSRVNSDYNGYTDALIIDIENISRKTFGKKDNVNQIDTLYFGGGTPTLLPLACTLRITDAIRENFVLSPTAEVSIEVNPNSATEEKLKGLVEAGFNRFSIGLQCANDVLLRQMGRPHTVDDFCKTVSCLHQLGQDNVGCDIILGFPSQTANDVRASIDLALSCGIKHISAYGLQVEKGTQLYRRRKEYTFPDDDAVADYYDCVTDILSERGFTRYEVSNFALRGYECAHNGVYWDYDDYYAVGASASGFVNKYRYTNYKNVDKYVDALKRGQKPCSSYRHIPLKEQYFEYVMLALRRVKGINLTDFAALFGVDFYEIYGANAMRLLKEGFLFRQDDRLFVRNFNILNSILTELLF